MAFQTGSANSAADLLTAIQGFCVSNGWTLSGSVLSKGNGYTQLTVAADGLSVLGGTGVDGANNLVGAGPQAVTFNTPANNTPLVYPVKYFLHVFANEVYALINWSVNAYTFLAFGCSPFPGLPGTGGWYCSSYAGNRPTNLNWSSDFYTGMAVDYNSVNSTGLFWCYGNATPGNGYVHHGLDGTTWTATKAGTGQAPATSAKTAAFAGPLMQQGINQWNGQAPLIPVHVYIDRGSSKLSIIASLLHVRYINMGNLAPEQIVTLGPDRWKVYPFFRKGSVYAPSGSDSGWMAIAVRYDGP
jgi:hypothetical protein